MKIAALLGVKDEVELIGPTVDHLRSIGVGLIVVYDLGSTDGTKEVLETYRSADLRIVHQTDLNADLDEFRRGIGAVIDLVVAANADWLLIQDADEFWLPATGNLKECAMLDRVDLLSVVRFNVPPIKDATMLYPPFSPDKYDRVPLVIKSHSNFRKFMRQNPTTPWILRVPVPKVMVRPALIVSFLQGGHGVVPREGVVLRRIEPADLLIAHLPFTTQTRFTRKIANIRRNLQVHDKNYRADAAWHWRRWTALIEDEGISAEFERSRFDAETTDRLRRQGIVRTAAEVFKERSRLLSADALARIGK